MPIVILHGDYQQLIGIPIIPSGSGDSIAKTVYNLLEEHGLLDKIQGMCFDTTSVNTGRFNGAAVILEQLLERDLFHAPALHTCATFSRL